ncbi:hypothetical protein TTHERM_00537050 (macronuclear) [Tetrahymena thermophila SB210]|uniref:DnaJ-like protein C11 C-terminal domain-containing protein n=1 Tax=Tetrahymena thermophila (strain SB210) TaxID=312017 RepID=I7MHU0_TETTS|nr:hypothetical protein TTHERM_00537050 [Tetrahymena thermophila SB210]EAS03270.1 hypothetical protein TTHERM_00537050 [Tetrahymena thermophila SB210]|eukprot:XP_001023515.1 hypothetical protein TTHERM_00537050 [Tetrahymena thermophila SB210]
MSQLQKQYNDEAFKKDLKKLKIISKKKIINSVDKSYETRTVFNLKSCHQINKRFIPTLQYFQKNKYDENFTYVKVNKPEIKIVNKASYLFLDKNMVAMSDIKMPLYQNLHFHLNLGIVQNRQSPSYFLYPYLKYYYNDTTLLKLGYYKSRADHISFSVLKNIYADMYLSAEIKQGEYIQGVPLSQKTFRFIKLNSNSQVYLNYGDIISLGIQHQLWKRGNYKALFNLEYNDLQFDKNPSSNLFLKTQVTKKIPNTNFSINLQANQSFILSEQEINASYKVNNYWKVKLGIQIQSDYINLIAGFKKSNFELSLPVLSFEASHQKLISLFGIVSLVAILGIKYFKKSSQKSENEKEAQYQKALEEKIKKRKGQLSLIEFQSQENNQYQINRNGLIIIEGYYGNSQHIKELKESINRANYLHQNKARAEVIDVTIPLRFFQSKRGLNIQTLSKENLIGFFNPCRENDCSKSLLIRYSLYGQIFEQIYMDNKDVEISLQD